MSKALKLWGIGLSLGLLAIAIDHWGSPHLAQVFFWIGWGFAAYGIGSAIMERLKGRGRR